MRGKRYDRSSSQAPVFPPIQVFVDASIYVRTSLTTTLSSMLQCDGTRPDPCGRCLQRKLFCVYEPHTKTHKDDLIREIENLRGDNESLRGDNETLRDSNSSLQTVNKALAEAAAKLEQRHNLLKDISESQRQILDAITNNGHGMEIISRLRAGASHQSTADWLSNQEPIARTMQTGQTTHRRIVEVIKIFEARYGAIDLSRAGSPDELDAPWTKVCSSHTFILHLFYLYFTWIHPVHMLFSESDFKSDFQTRGKTHCSSSLVNAICAMACHLLEAEHASSRSKADLKLVRDGFLNEALASLSPENYHHLTSIQTFAIIYLAETSDGRANSAYPYLRSATDYLNASKPDQQNVRAYELSGWGIHTLKT